YRPPDRSGARRPRPAAAVGDRLPNSPRLVHRGDGRRSQTQTRDRQVPVAPGTRSTRRDAERLQRELLMDLQQRLADHWANEVARTPVTDLGEIMDRGDTLRRRRTLVVGAVPIVVVIAAVATF